MLIKQPTKINCLIYRQRSCVAYFRAGFSENVSSLEVGKAAGELENVVELSTTCHFKKAKVKEDDTTTTTNGILTITCSLY